MMHINGLWFYEYAGYWFLERPRGGDIKLLRKPIALLEAFHRQMSDHPTMSLPSYRRV